MFFGPFAASVKISRLRNRLGASVSDGAESHEGARYFVSGTVQGVGYRFFARRTAERLKLAGFAKNLADGRVEVYAIGPAGTLEKFREELRLGPEGASVSGVVEEVAEIEARFANFFSIER
jgi:acylphosphatase